MAKLKRKAQVPKATGREASKAIGLRIKLSRYRLLQEALEEMYQENPMLRNEFTEVALFRYLLDRWLIERGKLKQ